MVGVKDQIMSIFKTKDYSQPKRVKTVYRGRKKPRKLKVQKQFEDNVIKTHKESFYTKKKKIKQYEIIRDILKILRLFLNSKK